MGNTIAITLSMGVGKMAKIPMRPMNTLELP